MKVSIPFSWLLVPNSFALDLSREMARQGVSQCTIARRAGLSNSSISDLINGRRTPRGRDIAVLAAALGLIEFVDPPPHTSAKLWRTTKQGWLALLIAVGLLADILGVWSFFE